MYLTAVLAVAGSLAAACGGSSGGSTSTVGAGASQTSAATSTAAARTITTRSGSLGAYLTDAAGRAVYAFSADTAHASKCTGTCAKEWPPLTTAGAPNATGQATSGMLGTLARTDGRTQVTYDGHPLYYFAGDSAAGDTNGEGIDNFGGRWYVVAPSGHTIVSGSSSPTSGGGYNYSY
jgi:predicted lipoprotein with Yx(FWY)xxD motif